MKHIFPSFYKNFKCIADKCPDSCCKDWDVVVDDESYDFYRKVKGKFGEKLNSLMEIDGDGDRIFVSQNGKCPFWNKNKLCDIYINLGEERLCETCKSFPRITQEYTSFTEHMLSLACPEAARLILTAPNPFDLYKKADDTNAEVSGPLMTFLLKARQTTFEIFRNESLPFSVRLKQALDYNSRIQDMLDSESYNPELPDKLKIRDFSEQICGGDCSFVFELHKRLEIMGEQWRNILEETSKNLNAPEIHRQFDGEFSSLAQYYVFRYYLSSIDSEDVLSAVKRIACCYIVISKAENHMNKKYGSISFEKRARLIQLYSKEVEHSYENSEFLEEEFFTNPDFSAENLIGVIQ